VTRNSRLLRWQAWRLSLTRFIFSRPDCGRRRRTTSRRLRRAIDHKGIGLLFNEVDEGAGIVRLDTRMDLSRPVRELWANEQCGTPQDLHVDHFPIHLDRSWRIIEKWLKRNRNPCQSR
jgi:hypothetical protein